jgi:hypothetical protein
VLLRASPHPGKRPAGLLAALAAMTTVLVLGATPAPAQAVVCETPGHAYLTQPGKIYVSGYEGKENFGIPRIVAYQGQLFHLGGNGILPDSKINFESFRYPGPGETSGTRIDVLPSLSNYYTRDAQDNCVVHEEGPYRVTAPPGRYRIFATYRSGNNTARGPIPDVVADFEILQGPVPSPAPTPLPLSDADAESLMTPDSPEPPPAPDPEPQPDPY